jgi:hypothetical protein
MGSQKGSGLSLSLSLSSGAGTLAHVAAAHDTWPYLGHTCVERGARLRPYRRHERRVVLEGAGRGRRGRHGSRHALCREGGRALSSCGAPSSKAERRLGPWNCQAASWKPSTPATPAQACSGPGRAAQRCTWRRGNRSSGIHDGPRPARALTGTERHTRVKHACQTQLQRAPLGLLRALRAGSRRAALRLANGLIRTRPRLGAQRGGSVRVRRRGHHGAWRQALRWLGGWLAAGWWLVYGRLAGRYDAQRPDAVVLT